MHYVKMVGWGGWMAQRRGSFLHFEIQSLQIYILNNITFCKLLLLFMLIIRHIENAIIPVEMFSILSHAYSSLQ